MKKLLFAAFAVAGIVSVAKGAGLYVPQGDIQSLSYSPLHNGEMCWIPYETEVVKSSRFRSDDDDTITTIGYASLYIGDESVRPLRVIDPGALRGTTSMTLDDSEVSIGTDQYFTTAGDGVYTTYHTDTWMNGTNSCTSVTGQVYIAVGSKYVISSITYGTESPSFGIGMTYRLNDELTISANKATITLAAENGCPWAKIKNIKVTVHEYGEDSWVNDLMTRTWKLKDQYGTFDFADLRYWTTHLYDGNRGEHWANYKALNNVYLDNNKIYFDSDYSTAIAYANKKLSISMWGTKAMQIVEGEPDGVYTGEMRITAVNKLDDTYQLSYFQSIKKNGVANFDPTQLIVKYAPQLESNESGQIPWEYLVNGSDFTVTDLGNGTGTCDIPYNIANKSGFYQLVYKGNMSNIMKVEFNAPVYVKKGLYVVGEDGVTYKISINAGVITAVAQ